MDIDKDGTISTNSASARLGGSPGAADVFNVHCTNSRPAMSADGLLLCLTGTPVAVVGKAMDDGLPTPPAAMTSLWTQVAGAGGMTITNISNVTATMTQGQWGHVSTSDK